MMKNVAYRKSKRPKTLSIHGFRTILILFEKVHLVPPVGLEPTLLAEPDFESGVSTNFTTEARSADSINIWNFSLEANAAFVYFYL